jgi:FixJ family two-component response regulator
MDEKDKTTKEPLVSIVDDDVSVRRSIACESKVTTVSETILIP